MEKSLIFKEIRNNNFKASEVDVKEKNDDVFILIQKIKNNEDTQEALGELFIKCRKTLVRNLYQGLDLDEVNDLLSEIFMDMKEFVMKYDPSKASFSTWISKISFNKKINYLKKREKKLPLSETLLLHESINDDLKNLDPAKINESIEIIQDKMLKATEFIFIKYKPIHHIMAFIIQKTRNKAEENNNQFTATFEKIAKEFFGDFEYLTSIKTQFERQMGYPVGDPRNWPLHDNPQSHLKYFDHIWEKIILKTIMNEYLVKFGDNSLILNKWASRVKKRTAINLSKEYTSNLRG